MALRHSLEAVRQLLLQHHTVLTSTERVPGSGRKRPCRGRTRAARCLVAVAQDRLRPGLLREEKALVLGPGELELVAAPPPELALLELRRCFAFRAAVLAPHRLKTLLTTRAACRCGCACPTGPWAEHTIARSSDEAGTCQHTSRRRAGRLQQQR